MKILKTLMEQKGMEIPAQPVVYVLCREYGEYSDYGMTVEKVFVNKTEADCLAYEYNNFIDCFMLERKDKKIPYYTYSSEGPKENPEALSFLADYNSRNSKPSLMAEGEYNSMKWWHSTRYSVHEVEAQ